jgi:hypothetical protein
MPPAETGLTTLRIFFIQSASRSATPALLRTRCPTVDHSDILAARYRRRISTRTAKENGDPAMKQGRQKVSISIGAIYMPGGGVAGGFC